MSATGVPLSELEGTEWYFRTCLRDDAQALVLADVVMDKGLVIVTGCSHAGIINIANQAVEVAGGNKIEGIIGGLHLVEASDTVIRKTVEELSKLKVVWVSAGHCTGFKAQVELYLAFRERFLPLHTGMQFELVSTDGRLVLK